MMSDLLAYTAAVIIMLVSMAAAHETKTGWAYPIHCCSNRDCTEIDAARVRVTPDGYVVDGAHLVRFSDALKSPDAQYHACFVRPYVPPMPTTGKPRCFFAPPGMM